jgi:hypothetical protein
LGRAWKYLYENHPEARFKIKRLAMGSVESGILPDGTDISETEARALEVSKWLGDRKENPEIARADIHLDSVRRLSRPKRFEN